MTAFDAARLHGALGKKATFLQAMQELQDHVAKGAAEAAALWPLVERVSVLLKTRYTGDQYWRVGQQLFRACQVRCAAHMLSCCGPISTIRSAHMDGGEALSDGADGGWQGAGVGIAQSEKLRVTPPRNTHTHPHPHTHTHTQTAARSSWLIVVPLDAFRVSTMARTSRLPSTSCDLRDVVTSSA